MKKERMKIYAKNSENCRQNIQRDSHRGGGNIDKKREVVMMGLPDVRGNEGVLRQSGPCGCSLMVKFQPSKLATWVRFPSPAPSLI
jgi:hypothetical protein